MMAILKTNLQEVQNRMKMYADKHRSERVFQVGDEVYLKLQPYRQGSLQVRRNLKLTLKYFRPFVVEEKIGSVAYRLKLPPNANIHPVFHVSLLKKKIGHRHTPLQTLPVFDDYGLCRLYPAAILARRLIPRHNEAVPQLLIQWENYSPEEATWEDYYSMAAKFPDFIKDPRGQGPQNHRGYVAALAGGRRRPTHRRIAFNGDRQIEGSINKQNGDVLEKRGQINLSGDDVVLEGDHAPSNGLEAEDRTVVSQAGRCLQMRTSMALPARHPAPASN